MAPLITVISVGGSPAPVIYSLNQQKPDYVIYFVSPESRSIVRREVEPALEYRPLDHDIIMTPDGENLPQSVQALLVKLPEVISGFGAPDAQLSGDYTGGTKTMAAALVLVLAERGCRFSYVGGVERDKEGLGVVINGREQMLHLENPWEALAVVDLRRVCDYFNLGRFRAARDAATKAAGRPTGRQALFQALQHLSEGFDNWDNFHYSPAQKALQQGFGLLRPFAEGDGGAWLQALLTDTRRCLDTLERILADTALFKSNPSRRDRQAAEGADGSALISDLMANALRRGERERKYEDAVTRLYSAVEKLAKARLKVAWNIDNSNIDLESLPDPELAKELQDSRGHDGKIQLPLQRSYELLAKLDDPLGRNFRARQDQLRNIQGVRNHSLLAHGFDPVREATYRDLLALVLDFIGLEQNQLTVFPRLEPGEIIV